MMNRYTIRGGAALAVALTWFFALGATPATAGDWELERGEEGNQVFSRKIDGEKIREYKIEMRIDAPLDKVWAVLSDHEALAEHPRVFEKTILKDEGSAVVLYEKDDCSPLKPRDFVVRIKANAANHTLSSELTTDYAPDPIEDVVRVPAYRSSWVLTADGDATAAVYKIFYDPGGRVPAKLYSVGMPSNLEGMRDWFQARANAL